MKIQELFLKPVDRPIDGVIKADDQRNLQTELDEYVVTRDVARGLNGFTERYLDEVTANGVWISGFFGSGKSHLLKMLSLVLDETSLPGGAKPANIILPKIEDEIVRAALAKAANIPSRSILFNIDQKFDGIGGDHSSPVLEVFVKVLNELQGYYDKQGYIAQFEHDLDVRGNFVPFKETYLRVNGRTWEEGRMAVATATRSDFGRAYAEHFRVPESEAFDVMRHARDDYRVSIESFAQRVKEYIDKQPPGFRLNFFIDEVGQFIGQNSQRMLNLQTITETLGTVCNGRAWVLVTSQADLEGVLGGFRGMESQDISKIQGRFKTLITLASADVREVIQKRLLAKKEAEPEVLTDIYDREKENLQTLFRFGDGSVSYHGWRGSDQFCAYYPFAPYQFDLFQVAITQLSKHNAFTGRFTAVGERSMLAVFQEVVKGVRNDPVGQLATFDRMYDGIAPSIRGDMQTSVGVAQNRFDDALTLRVLKALFLLKWVREFKATPRNVAILLIDRPDIDIRAHETAVKAALATLESQSYLQRNGDIYEFLTNAEKDIEVEIKTTDIDESQVTDLLGRVLFGDVLRDPKIRYEGNGQDYTYARKLDDQVIGRDADIALNIITPDHPHHGDATTLAMHNHGQPELLAVLRADTRLNEQARLYLKTNKYIQQNAGDTDETRKAILDQRGQQNSQRRTAMQVLAGDLLGAAPLYINGTPLDTIGAGDPRSRFAKAFQELISFSYPNLRMLRGSYDEASLSDTLLKPDDLLSGSDQILSEAEQEILTYVRLHQNNGERTSIEEMVRHFDKRPYGWYPMAVLTLVGRLFRMGKVELRTTELLDARQAFDQLKNSRSRAAVRVRIQEQFDPARVNALKKFHHDYFDRSNDGTDARSVGECTAEAFADEARSLGLLLSQKGHYPFLEVLAPIADEIAKLASRDHAYLLNHLSDYEEQLLTAKDDLIAPIKAFMNGTQREAYDSASLFLREEAANLEELPTGELQPLRDLQVSVHPYRGNIVPAAKSAVSRLRRLLDECLSDERGRAVAVIDEHEHKLSNMAEFVALDGADRPSVLAVSGAARDSIRSTRFASGIRDRLNRYVSEEYPAQLALVSRLADADVVAGTDRDGGSDTRIRTENNTAPVGYTSASSLRPHCGLTYIGSSADLDQWLEALRQAAQVELDRGFRISL